MKVEKADLREQLGIAVNSSSLRIQPFGEGDLLRVAAMGAAGLAIQTGADLQGVPIAAMQPAAYRNPVSIREPMLDPVTPDERNTIAGELGPMLWHIRYGRQYSPVPRAIVLYARWLTTRRLFGGMPAERLHRFSARVLHEWLSDRCQPCGGTGKLERTRSGVWIRPRGSMQRNAIFGVCSECRATGRARPSQGERARWIGVAMCEYESDRWEQRFNAALSWLKHLLARRVMRPLTAQLERRTRRI